MTSNFSNKRGHFYGVHAANNFPDLFDDIMTHGVNVSVDEAIAVIYGQLAHALIYEIPKSCTLEDYQSTLRFALAGVGADRIEEITSDQEVLDYWDLAKNSGTGRAMKEFVTDNLDEFANALDIEEPTYIWEQENLTLQIGHLGGAAHIWVIDSEYVTYAKDCSPCIPGGGDLDNCVPAGDGQLFLCLPPKEYEPPIDDMVIPEHIAKLRALDCWNKKNGELVKEGPPNQEEIRDYYRGTGNNTTDLSKWLKTTKHRGCDSSFDESLHVFHYPEFIAVVGATCGVDFYPLQGAVCK